MKYILIASLLSCAVDAFPFGGFGQGGPGGQLHRNQQGQRKGAKAAAPPGLGATASGNGQIPSPADVATAVANWQADTGMVSNFLNTGKSITDNNAFKVAAAVAFNAEVNELSHKAIIDAVNGNQPSVIAANSTLAGAGAFQDVVNRLQQMATQGISAVANIDLINQNRCVNVLPNIDAYMASTGATNQAIRPKVCDQTGVAGGVQGKIDDTTLGFVEETFGLQFYLGTGATKPGSPPGTPAAAFAAAKALAAGTGNGLVQNGGNGGNTGNAGTGNAGTGNAGTGNAGTGNAGTGNAGTGNAGTGNAGTGNAGTGNAGTGNAGTGNAGTGNAGTGNAGTGNAGATGNAGTTGNTGNAAGLQQSQRLASSNGGHRGGQGQKGGQ
ncbi:hypothetical protein ACEQ8H_006749 [Pleosporales sp. CAS-2024a]